MNQITHYHCFHRTSFSNQEPVINRTIDNIYSSLNNFVSPLFLTSIIGIPPVLETPSLLSYSLSTKSSSTSSWLSSSPLPSDSSPPSSSSLPLPFPGRYIPPDVLLYHYTSSILAHIDKTSKAKERFEEVIRWLKQKWQGCNCTHNSHLFQTNNLTRNEREKLLFQFFKRMILFFYFLQFSTLSRMYVWYSTKT